MKTSTEDIQTDRDSLARDNSPNSDKNELQKTYQSVSGHCSGVNLIKLFQFANYVPGKKARAFAPGSIYSLT